MRVGAGDEYNVNSFTNEETERKKWPVRGVAGISSQVAGVYSKEKHVYRSVYQAPNGPRASRSS